jgi:hypothetical protein
VSQPIGVSGPYVTTACICEKVLHDRDGVLSLIRVVDRLMVNAQGVQPPAVMPPVELQPGGFSLVVSLKSGTLRGSHRLELQMSAPSGAPMWDTALQVLFEGDDRGVNAVTPLSMRLLEEGLYWFDVKCDGMLLTRVPFRVIYQTMQIQL